jgi:hypothetical protein
MSARFPSNEERRKNSASPVKYQIIVSGRNDAVSDKEATENLAKFFSLSEQNAKRILESPGIPLKRNIDLANAARLEVALRKCGLVITVTPEERDSSIAETNFSSKRESISSPTNESPERRLSKPEKQEPETKQATLLTNGKKLGDAEPKGGNTHAGAGEQVQKKSDRKAPSSSTPQPMDSLSSGRAILLNFLNSSNNAMRAAAALVLLGFVVLLGYLSKAENYPTDISSEAQRFHGATLGKTLGFSGNVITDGGDGPYAHITKSGAILFALPSGEEAGTPGAAVAMIRANCYNNRTTTVAITIDGIGCADEEEQIKEKLGAFKAYCSVDDNQTFIVKNNAFFWMDYRHGREGKLMAYGLMSTKAAIDELFRDEHIECGEANALRKAVEAGGFSNLSEMREANASGMKTKAQWNAFKEKMERAPWYGVAGLGSMVTGGCIASTSGREIAELASKGFATIISQKILGNKAVEITFSLDQRRTATIYRNKGDCEAAASIALQKQQSIPSIYK